MSFITSAVFSGPGLIPAQSQRMAHAALGNNTQGVCGETDLVVTQSDTPGMHVKVAAGVCLIEGTSIAGQGLFGNYNNAPITGVAISPGDPSNPRIDVVGVKQYDPDYDAGANTAEILVVEGTPAGSPVAPALPASFLPLAEVLVTTGESVSILTADITDVRTFAGDYALQRQLDVLNRLGSAGETGPDAAGPTSGTTPLTIDTITVPDQGAGRIHVWASYIIVKTVSTDRFSLVLQKDGATFSTMAEPAPTTSSQWTYPGTGSVAVAGGAATTINVNLTRISGTGTASPAVGSQSSLHYIFVPDVS